MDIVQIFCYTDCSRKNFSYKPQFIMNKNSENCQIYFLHAISRFYQILPKELSNFVLHLSFLTIKPVKQPNFFTSWCVNSYRVSEFGKVSIILYVLFVWNYIKGSLAIKQLLLKLLKKYWNCSKCSNSFRS